ncbi:MAG: hypothetical protein ACO3QV_07525 [Candidatus Nanopelagicaceae bacterium]|jgi:hypothetical protein
MIDSIVKDAVQEVVIMEVTHDLGPLIVVGFLAFVMFVGYHVTNKVEDTASKIRNKRRGVYRNG